jgi:hypothetical protein
VTLPFVVIKPSNLRGSIIGGLVTEIAREGQRLLCRARKYLPDLVS